MSISCPPAPAKKKEYISDIGKILVKDHGKKKFYTPQQVKKAHSKSEWLPNLDFSCWGMSVYSSHKDFDKYHQTTGEACDYVEMKTEMLQGLSISDGASMADISALNIDASWLDLGDVFGGILEGIGGFVSGIFEGL